MKLRKTLGLLISALAVTTALSLGAMPAKAQTGMTSQQASGLDLRMLAASDYVTGNWFWGLLNDADLLTGATAVAEDVTNPSVFYAGGPGYIATSSDSGVTWRVTLQLDSFEDAAENTDAPTNDNEPVSDTRLEGLREFIRNGLESHYDEGFIDSLLEQITDDDLQNAQTLEDIEALEGLELDMETDLSQIQVASDLETSVVLSEFDTFIQRYTTLLGAGAEPATAVQTAASSSAVWQFVTTPNAVYAVKSDSIYYSVDQGNSWNIFFSSATFENNILSLDVSSDGLVVAIGTTETLMLTRNGGADWADLSQIFDGAIYKIDVPDRVEDPIVVLTTEGLYHSRDMGLTWKPIVVSNAMNERILDVMPYASGMYVLTDMALYHSTDTIIWNHIPLGPMSDENIQQVIVSHIASGKLVVRTDTRIFEYDGGWKLQETSLMTTETGPLLLLKDGESLAMMASSSGVWIAQEKSKIEVSPEYQQLYDLWAKEPSDDLIIERALEAHYLDEWIEKRWGLRSRMAWLLPTLTFDYIFEQQIYNRINIITNMRFGQIEKEEYQYRAYQQNYWEIFAKWTLDIDKTFKDDISNHQITNSLRSRRFLLAKQIQTILKQRRAYQTTLIIDFPKLSTQRNKKDSKKYYKTLLGLQEIDANLNYLTGGWFIPAVQESHKH